MAGATKKRSRKPSKRVSANSILGYAGTSCAMEFQAARSRCQSSELVLGRFASVAFCFFQVAFGFTNGFVSLAFRLIHAPVYFVAGLPRILFQLTLGLF